MTKYRLRKAENIDVGVKRIATALVRSNISDLSSARLDLAVAIHAARKRCKVIRGLLRLVRSSIKVDFRTLDKQVGDASARLSFLRDCDVMTETVRRLRKRSDESISNEELSLVESILSERLAPSEVHQNEQKQIALFLEDMRALLIRIPTWSFRAGLKKAVRSDFAKIYRQGLELMTASSRMPSDANLHRWRKKAKYHEHQLQFLSNRWKGRASKRIAKLLRLAELLGDDHDLAVIQTQLREHEKAYSDVQKAGIDRFLEVLANRRSQLQSKAFEMGKELYSRCPAAIAKKLSRLK
jgi:CHAD domain-containing protein